ncbi:MAG: hypothetical protein LBR65_10185 [Culturomica sp.]|jgi:hypothetical protein|nr:hypothetical protein [Culturomica sp.]
MTAYIIIGVTFLLLAIFSVTMIFLYIRRPLPDPLPEPEPDFRPYEKQPTPVLELRELSKLNNWYFFEHLRHQIVQTGIPEKNPEFYTKYLDMFETHMDSYHRRLLEVLGRDNPRLYTILTKETQYENLSLHDMLLILMIDTDLHNREMAEILCIPVETQKKRKLRLKAKMEKLGGMPQTSGKLPEK